MPDLCPPMVAYILFLLALVLYNLYMRHKPNVITSAVYLVVGAILMWVLCAAGMHTVGWVILGVPIVFYVFLFAILVFENGFLFTRKTQTAPSCASPTPHSDEHSDEEEECEE